MSPKFSEKDAVATGIAGGAFGLWPEPAGKGENDFSRGRLTENYRKGTAEMGKKYGIGEPDNVSGSPKILDAT